MSTIRSTRSPVRELASERGQVLIVVALMFVVLLGFAGLAVDVSSAYSTRQFERTVADAAALAGAQDLQSGATRSVGRNERANARQHALDSLVAQLGPIAGSCPVDAGDVNCSLPPYLVSIKTPAPSCSCSDRDHAIQVTIRTAFQPAFARLLVKRDWDVSVSSVATLDFGAQYAVVALQPPNPTNDASDMNLDQDVVVDGSDALLSVTGDIGTNTSAVTTGGFISVDIGYFIKHHDDLSAIGDTWIKPDRIHPIGQQVSLILDPGYMYASVGGPQFSAQADGVVPCGTADLPSDYSSVLANPVCYAPGVYQSRFLVNAGEVAYLAPGAYLFGDGLLIDGTLGGGLISNRPGVVLVIPQTKAFDAWSAQNLLLNAGSESCRSLTCRATPAIDAGGQQVKTSAGLTLTIEVTRDADCFVGSTPVNGINCKVSQNAAMTLGATKQFTVAGVIYGPSDNMKMRGTEGRTGQLGQIVSWSVRYTGGALRQSYPAGVGVGLLRIDSACSAPGEPCTP